MESLLILIWSVDFDHSPISSSPSQLILWNSKSKVRSIRVKFPNLARIIFPARSKDLPEDCPKRSFESLLTEYSEYGESTKLIKRSSRLDWRPIVNGFKFKWSQWFCFSKIQNYINLKIYSKKRRSEFVMLMSTLWNGGGESLELKFSNSIIESMPLMVTNGYHPDGSVDLVSSI